MNANRRLLVVALLLTPSACKTVATPPTTSDSEQAPISSVSVPSPAAPRASARPSASAAASSAKIDACAVRMESVTFSECNPNPKQADYPECMEYWIQPHPERDDDCLPKTADIFASGWQAISDQVHARIHYVGSPPTRAELIRDTPDESPMKDPAMGPDPQLGAVLFEQGKPAELVFGSGMKSHLGTKSLRAKADAP